MGGPPSGASVDPEGYFKDHRRRRLSGVRTPAPPPSPPGRDPASRRHHHGREPPVRPGNRPGQCPRRTRERPGQLEEVLEWCLEVGVRILTVYAFSTENLRRPNEEIQHLMHLFAENFRKVGDDERVHRQRIRINVFGDRGLLPAEVIEAIEYAEARTKEYDSYRFNLAVAYGGREEILQAIRDVVRDAQAGKVDAHDIDEKFFSKRLYTADLPDPDLVLRTSGEERISNFLLWQLAYSELYFVDVYWPGFRKIDFLRALRSYQMRARRYGE